MGKLSSLFALVYLAIVISSCSSNKTIPIEKSWTNIDTVSIFKQSFHGLHVVDAQSQKVIYSKNADKYFVPASNTKIFSLFSGLKAYKDSIPFIKYLETDTTVIFEGMGDPTFLHPYFDQTKVTNFFKSRAHKTFYYYESFTQKRQGRGWMWDDYQYDYQAEISPLPIYGNLAYFHIGKDTLLVDPPYFKDFTSISNDQKDEIRRDVGTNTFVVPITLSTNNKQTKEYKPFITDQNTVVKLLGDTFKIKVIATDLNVDFNKTMYSHSIDTMFAVMMKQSDNMMAEQTLLSSGKILKDTFSTSASINNIIETYFKDMPSQARWADGSGLSRYNMFTPRSVVYLLSKIYNEIPQKRLFSLMATGGQKGTLSSLFKAEQPYVFAKTGTLSGVANISGYLVTNSGKVLIFSFMNNNFTQPAPAIRKQMETVLNIFKLIY
jgi:serine-type D-Ala-D-Ala carboxypeptidase/endopeptidase (penicillin-binding protein 4)